MLCLWDYETETGAQKLGYQIANFLKFLHTKWDVSVTKVATRAW